MSFLHIPPKLKPYLTRNFARTEWMRYRCDHNREWFRAVSAIIHLDIRLIVSAVVLWIFTLAAMYHGTFQPYKYCVLVAISLLGIITITLNTFYGRKIAHILCPVLGQFMLIMLLVTLQAVLLMLTGTDSSRTTLRDAEGTSLRITGVIREIRPLDSHTNMIILSTETAQYRNLRAPIHEDIRIYSNTQKQQLNPGTRVNALGTLENKGTTAFLKGASIFPQPNQNLEHTRALNTRMRDYARRHLDAETTALLLGTAYGDDSAMPNTSKENYKLSGLSHLTAVSGANIAIIFMAGYRFGILVRVPRRLMIGMGITAVVLYSTILTFEGSVIRSILMGSLGALAMLRGTGRNTLSALATTIVFCLIAAPKLAGDLGFVLSTVATASLIALGPSLTRLLMRVLPHALAELIAASASASLWCTPVILGISGKIPLYTIPANMLAAPLTAITMFVGLAAFLSYSINFTAITDIALILGRIPAQGIEYIAKYFAHAPANPLDVDATPASVAFAGVTVFAGSLLIWLWDYRIYKRELHLDYVRIPGTRHVTSTHRQSPTHQIGQRHFGMIETATHRTSNEVP